MSSPSTLSNSDSGFHSHGKCQTAIKTLRSQLKECAIKSAWDKYDFVSRSCIDRISPDQILRDLRKHTAQIEEPDLDLMELRDYVFTQAKKTYLVLLKINQPNLIYSFFEYQFTDAHLPITDKGSSHHDPSPTTSDPKFCRAYKVFEGKDWDEEPSTLSDFFETQWQFFATVFTKDGYGCVLSKHVILPLVPYTEQVEQKSGGFSKVIKVMIEPSHIVPSDTRLMALKESNYSKMSETETETLHKIRSASNPHLVDVVAAFRRGDKSYILFPWAEGGNLREFWEGESAVESTVADLKWVLKQLCGIADGIKVLHDQNIRHGDVKPENTLVFRNFGQQWGDLVIADVGLAKAHSQETKLRSQPTGTMSGTRKYEPPEAHGYEPLSRVYDTWSLGCICLEFIIWFLWGVDDLRDFGSNAHKFWDNRGSHTGLPIVHPKVQECMQWMRTKDPRCQANSALGDLLLLVERRLLIVAVGNDSSPESLGKRAKADEFYEKIKAICNAGEQNLTYLTKSTGTQKHLAFLGGKGIKMATRTNQQAPGPRLLGEGMNNPQGPSRRLPSNEQNADDSPEDIQLFRVDAPSEDGSKGGQSYTHPPLNDIWEITYSKDFATDLYKKIDRKDILPEMESTCSLCERCSTMGLWDGHFETCDSPSGLLARSSSCDMCKMFYEFATKWGRIQEPLVKFYRVESSFRLERNGSPVLSLYGTPGAPNQSSPGVLAFGFPRLPPQGGKTQITLIREWLLTCDNSTSQEHSCHPSLEGPLPTRVLDIGNLDLTGLLHIHCSHPGQSARYVALSHRWGTLPPEQQFYAQRSNFEELRGGFPFARLPRTFQDAVRVTKGLDIRFLWIDSFCIIQDDPEDWERESQLMETVFSSAYLTIAASCADNAAEGFLHRRSPRKIITVKPQSGTPYYVCEHIDDFRADVEEGPLNKRGWVLQERALSHRTIYFTSSQLYWECGRGVRCETLATMRNNKSAFLGDSEFPKQSAKGLQKGGRIRLYEEVYKMYSKLAFTRITDRAIAITGLERRLNRAFKTAGEHGVFAKYLGRSLLWQRAGAAKMQAINYPPYRKVPSWSWMAYDGHIQYVDIPFGKVEWIHNIESPFLAKSAHESEYANFRSPASNYLSHSMIYRLPALASKLHLSTIKTESTDVVFDTEDLFHRKDLQCVIIARDKDPSTGALGMCYVLIIAPHDMGSKPRRYRRVGAGHVEVACVNMDVQSEVSIW